MDIKKTFLQFSKRFSTFFGTFQDFSTARIMPLKSLDQNLVVDESGELLSTVYTCAKVLAQNLSRIPLEILLEDKKSGNGKKIDKQDNRNIILRKPNKYTKSIDFWAALEYHRTLTGNAFARIIRGDDGRIRELRIIRPDFVSMAVVDDNGNLYYKVWDGKEHADVHSDEILHFRSLTSDGIFGLNPIDRLKNQVSLSQKGLMTLDNFYENNAMTPLALKPVINVAQTKEIKAALAAWKEEMGPGYLNSGNIMTLPHGYDLQPIAQNFVDAQFLETMKFTKSDIAALYGVPAHLVGVSDGVKYTNNYGQMMLDFKVNTMAPIFTQYEQELETKLLYDEEILEGKQIRYNTDLLIELDVDTRMKLHRSMLEMGAKTTDEIRAEEGYEAYPDKELSGKPLIATGLMSFEKAFIVKNT